MATKTKKINPPVASNITIGDNLQALATKKAEEEKNKIFETLPKWEFVPVLPKFLVLSESVNQDNFVTTEGFVFIQDNAMGSDKSAAAMKAFSLFTKLFDKGIMQSIVSKVNELIFATKTFEKSFYTYEVLDIAIDETLNMENTETTNYDTFELVKKYCYWYFRVPTYFISESYRVVTNQNLKVYQKVSKKAVEFGVEDIFSLGIARLMKGSQELLIDQKFKKVCENNEVIKNNNIGVVGCEDYVKQIFAIMFPNESLNDILNSLNLNSLINQLGNNNDSSNQTNKSNSGGNGGGGGGDPDPDIETTSPNWLLIGAVGILVLIFFIKKSRK